MVDRISRLPESLIERILEGLPQIERIRTSILSTRWRLLWTQLSSLKFDWGFYGSVCTRRNRTDSDYLCIINNLLLQRKKNVLDLSLAIPSSISKNDVSDWAFDQLIKWSVSNGVQKLSVEAHFMGGRHNLPFSYFTCSTVCLTHLQLYRCSFFPPSSFQGFPTLVSFEFRHCRTTTEAICRFVVGCPTLQSLVLRGLNFPDQTLDVDAPVLRYLSVRGSFKWIFLLSADSIEELAIEMLVLPDIWDGLPALSSTFFDSMAKLKKIKIGGRFCELLARHGDSLKLARYDGLRSLAFDDLRTKDEVVYALNSIKRYPNLTELTISLAAGSLKGEIDYDLNDYSLKCLLTVQLQFIWGSSFWMKLIERLLYCSSALKLMSIHFNSKDEWVKSVGEILIYCRASNAAKINVSNCNNFLLHEDS